MGKIIIPNIGSNIDLSLITATSNDILYGKISIDKNGNKITGTIPTYNGKTITPSTSNQTISAGQYLEGNIVISGDADLVAANVRAGKNIFGVQGNFTGVGGSGGLSSASRASFTVLGGSGSSWYYVDVTHNFSNVLGGILWNSEHWYIWDVTAFVPGYCRVDGDTTVAPIILSSTQIRLPVAHPSSQYSIRLFGY